MPTRGSALAAGYDLYSAHNTVIPGRGKALVDTELAIAVPQGTCMLFSALFTFLALPLPMYLSAYYLR
jgi:dUTPase